MSDHGGLIITREPVTSDDAAWLMAQLSATLQCITGDSGLSSFDPQDLQHAGACFVVARNYAGTAVGCGALRPLSTGIAELKRMYAAEPAQGIGRALLAFLEQEACQLGYREIWLETRRVNQAAVRFYLRHGYQLIDNYGRYNGNLQAVCFCKVLV
ncbi:GNAT family N-acetyltransferase [Erwiniaceae bacterium BAC15a-03b]|uniref:GNAT family N-acetyltransferase n=1 Tax=Winslowiella arboricola TaxID=2978220 RepID=A0A9J6PY18_9GAMM|nr:GNAT family N-acetyltransferase [Winslowiella arboricola]MCU5772927.1 GNAT family N-acetyltransferase [Winslowiella arboricola]MCU5780645.1 GNAT family N-acetyltransferase [Winslowiella arboricola]